VFNYKRRINNSMTDTISPDLTPDQIATMRAEISAYDAAQAAARAATEAARMLPLRQYTNSDAYQTLLTGLDAIVTAYGDDAQLGAHVQCLKLGLTALAANAGPLPTA
jgi:hypothetical protein